MKKKNKPTKNNHKKDAPHTHNKRRGKPASTKKTSHIQSTNSLDSRFILYGLHAVEAALLNPKRKVEKLYLTDDHPFFSNSKIADIFSKTSKEIKSKYELDELSGHGAVHQNIVAKVQPLASLTLEEHLKKLDLNKANHYIMLDQVSDPHNIGAIMRSACAFGAVGIIVQDKNAPPLNATIAKIACGAADQIDYIEVTNLARSLDTLKDHGFWSIALDERGEKTIRETVKNIPNLVLVMGAEGPGLRPLVRKQCDLMAKLPTTQEFWSLNVSNAAAISLYEAFERPLD